MGTALVIMFRGKVCGVPPYVVLEVHIFWADRKPKTPKNPTSFYKKKREEKKKLGKWRHGADIFVGIECTGQTPPCSAQPSGGEKIIIAAAVSRGGSSARGEILAAASVGGK